MNEHNHMAVISCAHCGQKFEMEFMHILDSKENAHEKQLLLSGKLFEHNCSKCHQSADLLYELTYVDRDNNIEIYLVHEDNFDGANMMLHMTDAVERKYKACENTFCPIPRKRIVTCKHQLKEKIAIFDEGFDDRIIEMIKLICIEGISQTVPDFEPMYAEFDIHDGKPVINLYGEERTIVAAIPDGLADQLADDFEDLLVEDNSFVVNEYWAMEAMGIDPYDNFDDCDGDCEHCPHNCANDDCDDIDERCDGCECDGDCDNCPNNDWSCPCEDCECETNCNTNDDKG